MLIIWGLRFYYRTIAQGVFFCRNCGGDRNYRLRKGRRFFHIFWIPLIPLPRTAEHVLCTTCKTKYVTDVLQMPAAAQPGIVPQPGTAPPPWMAPQPAQPGTGSQPGTAPQQEETGTQPGSTPWWA